MPKRGKATGSTLDFPVGASPIARADRGHTDREGAKVLRPEVRGPTVQIVEAVTRTDSGVFHQDQQDRFHQEAP